MTATPANLRLEQIEPHPLYDDPVIIEQHVLTEYMLAAPKECLTTSAINSLLELHPIHVVEGRRAEKKTVIQPRKTRRKEIGIESYYYCVGGIRSLSISRHVLLPSDSVPVLLLSGIKKEEAKFRCYIDVFLTSCLSLRKTETLYRIYSTLPTPLREMLIPPHNVSPAKIFGIDGETIRLWKQKKI